MATVTGTIKTPEDAPYTGHVRFRALSTPLADAPDLIVGSDVVVQCDALGQFSTTLRNGRYQVTAGRETETILVPDDALSHDILTLIE